jgi:hypothetical protein
MKRIQKTTGGRAMWWAGCALVATPMIGAAENPRDVLLQKVDAVIGIEMVVTVKVKVGDRERPAQERRVEVNGTVVTPDGLTVASLAQVDPAAEVEAAQLAQPGRQIELLGADFKEVKLRRANGTEVPARFVLKDADLDLAFIAPEEADGAETFAHVDLGAHTDAAVLDKFYSVTRASKALQRVPIIMETAVTGIVEKPRRIYLVRDVSLGSPVFDGTGRLLGLALQHFAGGRRVGIVVLPAEDIAEVAKQAAAAQKSGAVEGAVSAGPARVD